MTRTEDDNNNLANQLFQYIFGLYCFIAITVTAIQIIEEYRYTQKTITQELATYQQIFGQVLAKALWHLDKEQINDVTKGLSEVPIIVGVKIERLQGNKLVPYSGLSNRKQNLTIQEQFSYQFPIEYTALGRTQLLGRATLYSDSSIVFDRVKLGFTFLIINAVIKGIALWLIFWFISRKLLITPLSRLIDSIKSLTFDQLSTTKIDLKLKQKNELSVLENNFNDMIQELNQAKDKVTKFNAKLEQQVNIRTQELNEARNQAEITARKAQQASMVKSQFLSHMSHELRTPLNGIEGMLYLMSTGQLDDKQKYYVQAAQQSSKQLLQLINDVLDISALEDGQLDLEKNQFELYSLLSDTIAPLIDSQINDNTISVEMESLKGLRVEGDEKRLAQIIHLLLGNAIKFTHEGQINIKFTFQRLIEDQQAIILLNISINDTGLGIAADIQEQIFDNFSQGNNSSSKEYEGAGLGLSLCKKLCQKMSGDIYLTSELGKGSEFNCQVKLVELTS